MRALTNVITNRVYFQTLSPRSAITRCVLPHSHFRASCCGTSFSLTPFGSKTRSRTSKPALLPNAIAESSNATEEKSYTFADEGPSVEVRVKLPGSSLPVSSSQIAVTVHDDSLLLTLATDTKLIPLLVASPLYAHISASNTVWFLDDEEIVVHLEKIAKDAPWPDLTQGLGSLARGVGVQLQSCSINLVGPSSEINWAVARELSSALGYVPMETRQLVESVATKTVSEIIEEEDESAVADVEAAILESLTTNVRCLVATMGGPCGTASSQDGARWRYLHPGITVWLSSDGLPEGGSDVDSPYSRADVKVVGEPGSSPVSLAEGVLRAVKQLLDSDPGITKKKGLYLRLGCRGDWPNIMPPGWNPDLDSAQVENNN